MFLFNRIAGGAVLLIALAFGNQPALAWGPPGHRLIGALAFEMLNPTAKDAVTQILDGYDLGTAAKWADCARSVVKHPDGTFTYVVNPRFQPPCDPFMAKVHELEDYASRNWTNCDNGNQPCASSYHFADVPYQRGEYDLDQGEIGTNSHDVVHAIRAMVDVLKGAPAPAPFNIANKKEALMLLAHFVGDIHQPLHVGSIYLSPNGKIVDPNSEAEATDDFTTGGNDILKGQTKLHAEWDDILASLDVDKLKAKKKAALLTKARAVPASTGDLIDWPVDWATDTIKASPDAFRGLKIGKKAGGKWPFTEPSGYSKRRNTIQERQMVKAAARLAELLNAIWPHHSAATGSSGHTIP
jgi:hypothetical protein